jgi:hypothetical protein
MSNTQQLLDNWEGIDSNESAALHDVRMLMKAQRFMMFEC